MRLGWVLQWGLCVAVIVPAIVGVRRDAASAGFLLVWCAGVAQFGVGLWLVHLALREAIPAAGPSRDVRPGALLTGAAVPVVGVLVWLRLGMPHSAPGGLAKGMTCMTMESLAGLPAMLLTALLVGRTSYIPRSVAVISREL